METRIEFVLDLDGLEFWFLMAALLGVAIYSLHQAIRTFWRLRTILDTPRSRIKSASQGYLELSGFASERDGVVPAPLTDKPCVWYRYRVQKRRGSGRDSRWTTVEEGTAERPFLLDDGSGRCLVEPEGARLKLQRTEQWLGPHRDPRQRQIRFAWLGGGERYRFTESRIQAGDPVYLLGRFETPRRGTAERQRLQRELLRLWKRDPKRMASFDLDGDGQISPDEWERARQEAERLADRSEEQRRLAPPVPRVVDTGDPRHPFIISTHSLEDLTSSLRWTTFAYTAGFVCLVGLIGFAVIQRLGVG
ncbi:GIDE domain-containing protein [Thiocystis violacea]|uniref:GIDE domain-containing protein n=1 Tax=Thiocystis violacea TaxID=13725 RepID=UPI0019073858|nr:GIDE domain-containing protein [Thiocystis violacea]MBK1717566.1 hypothetical protein [Thiocystis violacea]